MLWRYYFDRYGVFGIILFCGTILGIATGLTWYPYMSINVIIMAICYGGIILTAILCILFLFDTFKFVKVITSVRIDNMTNDIV